MSSIIVWVLTIQMLGGYCMETPRIQFSTEKECETAKAGLDQKYQQVAFCSPKKKD